MQLSKLKAIGWIANLIVGIGALLTTPWILAMSVLGGIIVGLWAGALEIAQRPGVQLGVAAFLALLWTFIGLATLRDRKRPRIVSAAQDYSYGLLFEGLSLGYDPKGEDGALQLGVVLRNFSPGPLRYTVDKFQVIMGDRTLPRVKKGLLTAFIPRGGQRISRNLPFKRDSIKDFIGKPVKGTAEFTIAYGHPDRSPERQLKMVIEFNLVLGENAPEGYSDSILEESDEPYLGQETS
jgi:hypothetical protein